MKKALTFALLALILIPTFAAAADNKILLGVTPFPAKDIAVIAKDVLKKDGYDLVIKEFTDFVQPNLALQDKSLNANFFQHVPYLENMEREKNLDIVPLVKVHLLPIGIYSKKVRSLKDVKKGSIVAVPNDPTNGYRAYKLLEREGLLKMATGKKDLTARDVVSNPLGLKIIELEAPQLPRSLPDTTISVITMNFAVDAGLNPTKEALALEDKNSPYAVVLAVRSADKDTAATKALSKALNSPEVKKFITTKLAPKGVVPAF
ncbi:MAG: MetQ/NlpA family ABC transporter substrate-binding protein [Synergistaceae bacterium]|nr:MetQ/NlpA family ABC transporter substrate-binding protein [Synergistaceae bacterium]